MWFDYVHRMSRASRTSRAARPARPARKAGSARLNPNLLVQDSDYTANTLNADAAIYATLNQYQLWAQANGGDQWAQWELERRGITELPARPNGRSGVRVRQDKHFGYEVSGTDSKGYNSQTYFAATRGTLAEAKVKADTYAAFLRNGGSWFADYPPVRQAKSNPQGMNMQMILSESNLPPREPGLGGEWARWAEDREGLVRRNPRARNNHHIPVGGFAEYLDGRGYFYVTGPARRPASDDPTETGINWPNVEKFYPGITVQRGKLGNSYAWKTDSPDDTRYLRAIRSALIPTQDMTALRKVASKYGFAKINPHTSQGMSVTACNADEDHEEWANWALNREGILHRNPRTKFGTEGGYFQGSEEGYMYRGYIEVDGKRKYMGSFSSDKRDALNVARREAQRQEVARGKGVFKAVPKGGSTKWRLAPWPCDLCGAFIPGDSVEELAGYYVCSACAQKGKEAYVKRNPDDYDVLLVRKDDDGEKPAIFAVLRRSTITPAVLSKYRIGGERGTPSDALAALDRGPRSAYGDKDRSSPYYLWRTPGAQGTTTYDEKRAAIGARNNPALAAFIGGGRGLAVRDLITTRSRTSGEGGSGPKGGYSPAERKSLPTSDFLVPERRAWPVGDLNHAFIALQYMVAGRGRTVEYPLLLQRLAKLWPVKQNKDLWKKYEQYRIRIQRQCECRLPSAIELG